MQVSIGNQINVTWQVQIYNTCLKQMQTLILYLLLTHSQGFNWNYPAKWVKLQWQTGWGKKLVLRYMVTLLGE